MTANSIFQDLLWHVTKLHARAFGVIKDRTGRNLKGLGFLSRRLRKDRTFTAVGLRWYFDHRLATAYMRMLVGQHNEPETHALLEFLAAESKQSFTFIDVGANIGEMVIPMAAHPKVARSIGFEPNPVCANVCRQHAALNQLEKVSIQEHIVADGTPQAFVIDADYPILSGIRPEVGGSTSPTIRLDDALDTVAGNCVLLIDANGAEIDVMRGGINFIATRRPLIIFEYNDENRVRYTLDEVYRLLGPGYRVFRLRGDGRLDSNLRDSWNCVAVPDKTELGRLCLSRITGSN